MNPNDNAHEVVSAHSVTLAETRGGYLHQLRLFSNGNLSMPFASKVLADLLELTPEQIADGGSAFFRRIDPADWAQFGASMHASAKALTPWLVEFRVNLPRQGVKWLLNNAEPSRLDDGSVVWHGVIVDITCAKQEKEEIHLMKQAIDEVPSGIIITDLQGRIEWVNSAFSLMTGYAFCEVEGKHPGDLLQGQNTDQEVVSHMRSSLRSREAFEVEILNYHKSGHTFWQRLKVIPARNEHGDVYRFIGIQKDITEQKQASELIWRAVNCDAVTGLPNDRVFRDLLQKEIRKSSISGMPFALLFIDLDRFKEVNDVYAHQAGDCLLASCARRLSASVNNLDTVVRLGGDEFAVIVTEIRGLALVEEMAQRLRSALAEPFKIDGNPVYLSASIGISIYPTDTESGEAMLQNAHQAMYEAKRTGRNRVCYFTHSLQDKARFKLCMSNDLRRALISDQLKLYFQPIAHLATGRIGKAEALLRWIHPTRGMIGPAEFIPVAEECGLISEIGKWLTNAVFPWSKRLTETTGSPFQISINKSPVEIASEVIDADWPLYLNKFGQPGRGLCIEITEGLLLNSSASMIERLHAYRDAGIQIAIDDFGTGYSSMSYLQKFKVDYLKIDKSFVTDMTSVAADRTIVEAIILMAHKLGLQVVAEGVETKDQKKLLIAAGCDFGQGYLFSKAVLAEEVEELLDRS